MIEIHPVDRAYSAVLSALHCECLEAGNGEGWGPSAMEDVMRSPGVFALIAFDGQAPVGFALGRLVGDAAELLSLGVRQSLRRQGVGRALVCALAACVPRVTAIFLEVADDNRGAQLLYRQLGFAEVGRRANYYARGGGRFVAALTMSASPDSLG
jgi:[ribosomal protein S18]-alanine N-acetyltransferase